MVRSLLFICCFLALPVLVKGQTHKDIISVLEIAELEIGVREVGCNNCGARIKEYQKATNNKPGQAYCSSFLVFCFQQTGWLLRSSINGWSHTWFVKPEERIYKYEKIQPGDVIGIFNPKLKRIVHVEIVLFVYANGWVICIGGNTNSRLSREGDGVYMNRRSVHGLSIVRPVNQKHKKAISSLVNQLQQSFIHEGKII